MRLARIPSTFPFSFTDPDIATALCRNPNHCVGVHSIKRCWQDAYGGVVRVRVTANRVAIHDGKYNHHFSPSNKLLAEVWQFDKLGADGSPASMEAARKAVKRGRYSIKYIESIKATSRAPSSRTRDNEQRKERRKQYRARHGRSDPQQRTVGITPPKKP